MHSETVFTTQAAGDWLHEAIPGDSPEYWRQALINNRRADRNPPHRVPFSTIGRAAVYGLDALQAFAEFEKARRIGQVKLTGRAAEVVRAFGIGSQGGSATGRKLQVTDINPQVDETTGKPFVQLILTDPLMVYRLELDEAERIAGQLLNAIRRADAEASHRAAVRTP